MGRERERERRREKETGLRLKESGWIVRLAKFLRCSVPFLKWRCWRILGSFGVCVLVVLPSVLVLTILFSNVNVVVFSGSDCEFGEPQTCSLSRKRKACLAESQENMNYDGAQ